MHSLKTCSNGLSQGIWTDLKACSENWGNKKD